MALTDEFYDRTYSEVPVKDRPTEYIGPTPVRAGCKHALTTKYTDQKRHELYLSSVLRDQRKDNDFTLALTCKNLEFNSLYTEIL